ncbi:MAG: hypothetical protein ACE5KH_06770 [Candidatus Geothermarchaeales archaeon]
MYVLTDLFGDCPHVKVIEVLAENAGFDISRPEIHSEIGGSKTTVYSHIEQLLKGGIVRETRKVGRTQLYTLNLSDPRARLVVYLENLIVTEKLEETMGGLGIPTIPEMKPTTTPLELEEILAEPMAKWWEIAPPPLWELIIAASGTVEPVPEEILAAEKRARKGRAGLAAEYTPVLLQPEAASQTAA